MSALSSLIIVLDVLRDKKGRDWFSFERIWKKTQSRKPFRLAHGSSTLSPHTDAAFGCRDQSLSLTNVRELLPQPLWRCFLI